MTEHMLSYVKSIHMHRDNALAPTPDLLAIYNNQQKLFRQPWGAANPLPAIDGVNVITYNWHVDSNDCGWFLDPDLDMSLDEQCLDNVLGTPRMLGGTRWNVYEHGDGSIITFYDINRVTGVFCRQSSKNYRLLERYLVYSRALKMLSEQCLSY